MCCAIENYFSCQQIFLPQNGRKSRLSGTKRRSLASYVSCPKGGVRLDRGLSGYQFTFDKRKIVGRKQVHCQKIERLDFGHKGSTMRDLTSWPERGTQLSPRNGKRLLKTRRFDGPPTTTDIQRSRGGILCMRQLFGEANITALACCDAD